MQTPLDFKKEGYLSSKDAAQKAGFTNDYISRLCRLGKVSGQKVGNTWFVDEASLELFLLNQHSRKEDRKQELTEARRDEYKQGAITSSAGVSVSSDLVSVNFFTSGSVSKLHGLAKKSKEGSSLIFGLRRAFRSTAAAVFFALFVTSAFVAVAYGENKHFKVATEYGEELFRSVAGNIALVPDLIENTELLGQSEGAVEDSSNFLSRTLSFLKNVASGTRQAFGSLFGVFSSDDSQNGEGSTATRLEDLVNQTDEGVNTVSGNATTSTPIQQVVNTVNTIAATSSSVVLGINTDVSVRDDISVGGSASVGGTLQVSGPASFSGPVQANGGINTNGGNIDAGVGQIFASNLINAISAGTGVRITGTPQNPTISALVRSGSSGGSSGVTAFSALTDTPASLSTIKNRILFVNSAGDAVTTSAGLSFSGDTLTATQLEITTSGTSTFAGGLSVAQLEISSSTATSTFANGIEIESGCLLLPDGLCAISQAGSGASNYLGLTDTPVSHTANAVIFTNPAGDALTASSTFVFDGTNLGIGTSTPYSQLTVWGDGTGTDILANFVNSASTSLLTVLENGNVGVGTTSPTLKFSVGGDAFFGGSATTTGIIDVQGTGTSTFTGGLQANALNITGSATSTFNNGIQLTSGCFLLADGNCAISSASAGITSIGPAGELQTGATITLASSTSITNGLTSALTIVGSADTLTFTPSLSGTLTVGGGGTGLTTFGGTNTILYTSSADTLTSDTDFVFDGTNLGVGTSTPYSQLTVWGDGTGTDILANFVNSASTSLLTVLENGNVGVGTTSPTLKFSVGGDAFFGGSATTTGIIDVQGTGTSTFTGGISTAGLASSNGLTISGGSLTITSGATSTANNGINLTAGCFSVNGTCVESGISELGSGYSTTTGTSITFATSTSLANGLTSALTVVGSADTLTFTPSLSGTLTVVGGGTGLTTFGGTNTVLYTSSADTLTSNTNFVFDGTNLGVGTSTPYSKLSVWNPTEGNGARLFEITNNASTTLFTIDDSGNATTSGYLAVEGAATSTFGGGVNLTGGGCFSIGGTCTLSATDINTYSKLDAIVADVTLTSNDQINASSELIDIVGDETGSGLLVFNTDPLLQGFVSNASSTFTGQLNLTQNITSTYTGTSTFSGGISTAGIASSNGLTISGGNLTLTSGATSTANNGINLTAGCFSVSGTCIDPDASSTFLGLSDVSLSSFTAGSVLFTSGSAVVEDNTNFFYDNTNERLGLGTSSPLATLSASSTNSIGLIIDQRGTSDIVNFQDGGSTVFSIIDGGSVGIGTTSPYRTLSVVGDTILDSNLIEFGSSTASTLTISYNAAATSTIANNTLYAFSIATSTTATPIFTIDTRSGGDVATSTFNGGFTVDSGAISHDGASHETSIENLNLGNLSFEENAGAVTWIDLPVTSSAAAGTVESYTAAIDDVSLLTIYAESDGAGGIQNTAVGIGTTSPYAALSVVGEVVASHFTGTTTATSSLSGGLDVTAINQTGSATSTFANGIQLSGGCFEDASGSCTSSTFLGLSDVSLSAFTAGSVLFTSGSAVVEDNTNFFYDNTNERLGLGTSSPLATLSASSTNSIGLIIDQRGTSDIVNFQDGGSTVFSIIDGGSVGIGTTSPYRTLSVVGDTILDSNLIEFGSSTASTLTISYNAAATSTIQDSQVYAFSIATSTTATPIFTIDTSGAGGEGQATTTIKGGINIGSGAITYDYGGNITSIERLNLGPTTFEDDAGVVSWIDLPVTDAASSTVESYSARIDGTEVLTVYGLADGSGGANSFAVGIGTTTPTNLYNQVNSLAVAGTLYVGAPTTATSTFEGNVRILGTSQTGDLLFANDFVFTERLPIGGPETQALILKSQNGNAIFEIDEDGNAAFSTTTDSGYKVSVGGDIAATGFVNVSTRNSKKNIEHLSDDEEKDILTKIEDVRVARYQYEDEGSNDPLRLGLIAEEAPLEVLSADGKGVDLYKLSAFTLAGVQELTRRMNLVELRLDALESATSTTSTLDDESLLAKLKEFGVNIMDSVVRIARLVADNLTVGTPENPTGITLYDEVTGEPYCVRISNGALVPTPGECDIIEEEELAETPLLKLLGDNPAYIEAGQTYYDAGVATTSAVVGTSTILYYIDEQEPIEQFNFYTDEPGMHYIHYVITDSAGNTGTTTRKVMVFTPDNSAFEGVKQSNVPPTEQQPATETTDTAEQPTTTSTTTQQTATSTTPSVNQSGQEESPQDPQSQPEEDTATTTDTVVQAEEPTAETPQDTKPPIVNVIGYSPYEINEGDTFDDPGATATDEVDGDLTNQIIVSGNLDTQKAGDYVLTYSATDKAGNTGTAKRTIRVRHIEPAPEPKPTEEGIGTTTEPTQ